jgi:hypothetical protein
VLRFPHPFEVGQLTLAWMSSYHLNKGGLVACGWSSCTTARLHGIRYGSWALRVTMSPWKFDCCSLTSTSSQPPITFIIGFDHANMKMIIPSPALVPHEKS